MDAGRQDGHRIVTLWAVPRTASTAFERMMIERGDFAVFDEPFSAHYYFGPQKVSGRYAETRPESRPGQILARLEAAARAGPVFVKDMAYHVVGFASPPFMKRFVNTFLVRDPAFAIPSLARMWPDFTEEETGYAALARLVDLAEAAGQEPVILDSDDLCRDPEGTVRAWCEAVGIPFLPEALRWEAGMREEWGLWRDWYEATAASTAFRPPSGDPPPRHDPRVASAYERALPHYEALRARRLRATPD
jgi:Sulfotransferase domain